MTGVADLVMATANQELIAHEVDLRAEASKNSGRGTARRSAGFRYIRNTSKMIRIFIH